MGNGLKRQMANRNYRRLFLISCEGSVTEPMYFRRFNSSTIHVECLYENGKSSPAQVLSRLKSKADKTRLQTGDQLWAVMDRDDWPAAELDKVAAWASEPSRIRRGFALSNPKFEYWLLLHFEDGAVHTTARACVDALRVYLPTYDKHLDNSCITPEMIHLAITRAGDVTAPWPTEPGHTTVPKLVNELEGGVV